MMGLNILPLVPLDRNLNEQDQLGPLQEQKGGQKGAEASTQGLFVQSCEPEMRNLMLARLQHQLGLQDKEMKVKSLVHVILGYACVHALFCVCFCLLIVCLLY